MTPMHTYANPPTPRRPGRPAARFSASARPTPGAWFDPVWATTVVRAKITAAVVAILAVVVLFAAAPPTVIIPLTAVSVTGLFGGGVVLLVERLTRPGRARGDS